MSVSPEPHAEPFSAQKAAPRSSSSQSHQSGSQYRRIVTMGAKQRQLLFDLERHPFESSTMTQLFHILSKRSTQWWRVQEQRREREQREEDEAQQQQQQQGLDQTVGGASSALDSTVGRADTSRTSASPSHAKDVLSMLHGDRAASGRVRTALRHRTKQRGPNKPAGNQTASTVEDDDNGDEDEDGLQLEIPDTIVWENNIPKGWYYFDPKEKHVSRRKVETKQVQEALLRDAAFENDIVAVHYVMEGPASSSSGGGSSGGGSHHHHDSSTGSDGVLGFRYLTAAELPIFLFENRRGKGTSILQKFVYSLGAQHNDCIQVTWSPSVVHVHRRQNVNDMFDERIAPNTRCAIFEGRTHQSREMQCTPKLKERIGLLCKRLVSHFHETDAKHKISRLVLHVKISDASKLMILYCSSARVQKHQQAGQSGEPGSLSLELHQKFRVSVELATQYVTKELEGSSGGHTAGEHEALLAAQQDADHREGVLRRRLSMVAKSAEMTHVSVTNRQKNNAAGGGSPSKDNVNHHPLDVQVDGRSAAHHGFLMRTGSPAAPLKSGGSQRLVSSSASRTPSPTHRRRGSTPGSMRRSSSTVGGLSRGVSLQTIVQEVCRAESRQDSTAIHRARGALHQAVQKVGPVAARTALLQSRAEEELTEYERMELLFLRIDEADRRRKNKALRRASSVFGGIADTTSQANFLKTVNFDEAHGKHNVVCDGVPPDMPVDAQDFLMDLTYEAQSHFETQSLVPQWQAKAWVASLPIERSANAAAVYEFLRERLCVTRRVAALRGVTASEGATTQFELSLLQENHTNHNGLCASWTVPMQMRAAQKVTYLLQEMLLSPDFVAVLRQPANHERVLEEAIKRKAEEEQERAAAEAANPPPPPPPPPPPAAASTTPRGPSDPNPELAEERQSVAASRASAPPPPAPVEVPPKVEPTSAPQHERTAVATRTEPDGCKAPPSPLPVAVEDLPKNSASDKNTHREEEPTIAPSAAPGMVPNENETRSPRESASFTWDAETSGDVEDAVHSQPPPPPPSLSPAPAAALTAEVPSQAASKRATPIAAPLQSPPPRPTTPPAVLPAKGATTSPTEEEERMPWDDDLAEDDDEDEAPSPPSRVVAPATATTSQEAHHHRPTPSPSSSSSLVQQQQQQQHQQQRSAEQVPKPANPPPLPMAAAATTTATKQQKEKERERLPWDDDEEESPIKAAASDRPGFLDSTIQSVDTSSNKKRQESEYENDEFEVGDE